MILKLIFVSLHQSHLNLAILIYCLGSLIKELHVVNSVNLVYFAYLLNVSYKLCFRKLFIIIMTINLMEYYLLVMGVQKGSYSLYGNSTYEIYTL